MTKSESAKIPSKLLLACFVFSTVAVGIYWWRPQYGELQVLSSGWVLAIVSVVVAAAFASRVLNHSMLIGAAAAAGGIAAIAIRIVVEVVQDPTSHNLWPFELVIASCFIFPSALLGAAFGSVLKRLFTRT